MGKISGAQSRSLRLVRSRMYRRGDPVFRRPWRTLALASDEWPIWRRRVHREPLETACPATAEIKPQVTSTASGLTTGTRPPNRASRLSSTGSAKAHPARPRPRRGHRVGNCPGPTRRPRPQPRGWLQRTGEIDTTTATENLRSSRRTSGSEDRHHLGRRDQHRGSNRGPPSPARRRPRRADQAAQPPKRLWDPDSGDVPGAVGHVRQRPSDELGIDTGVHGPVLARHQLWQATHPDRPGLNRVLFGHLKAEQPHLDLLGDIDVLRAGIGYATPDQQYRDEGTTVRSARRNGPARTRQQHTAYHRNNQTRETDHQREPP